MSNSDWKPIIVMNASTGGKLTTVNPTEIVVLEECQARVDGTDDTLVAEYAADMREYDERIKESESEYPTHGWQEFPNLECIHVPDVGHVLISGHHRLEAILQVGYENILVYSVPGTRQDAIVWSKQQNADNGKRRTNADKAHVVKSCLLDDELKLWSNSTIAKWCDVSHQTVNNHEKSLANFASEKGELYTRPTRRKRLSKHGEIEWVETASIGNGSEKLNRKELKAKHHSAVVNVQSAPEETEVSKLSKQLDAEMDGWKQRHTGVDYASQSSLIQAYREQKESEQEGAATVEELKGILGLLGEDCKAYAVRVRYLQSDERKAFEAEREAERAQQRYEQAEKQMWQALWGEKAQVHAQNFITAACDAHLMWGVNNFPKNVASTDMPNVWTERFKLVTTEINIGSEWVTTFLESEYSELGSEKLEPKSTSEVTDDVLTETDDKTTEPTEPETAVETTSQTAEEREANKLRKQKKKLCKQMWDARQEVSRFYLGDGDTDLNVYLTLPQLERGFVQNVSHYKTDFDAAIHRTSFQSLNIVVDKTLESNTGIETLEKELRALQTYLGEIKYWQRPNNNWILPLIEAKKAKKSAKASSKAPKLTPDEEVFKAAADQADVEALQSEEDSPSLDDRMERLRSDLFKNHWQHTYSWDGLDILPFVEAYDIGAGIIDRIQKEIAADHPKPDTPDEDEVSQNGSNYRLEFLSIGLRDADDNPVKPLKFQLIASRELDERPLSEVPDALRAELLRLVEQMKS